LKLLHLIKFLNIFKHENIGSLLANFCNHKLQLKVTQTYYQNNCSTVYKQKNAMRKGLILNYSKKERGKYFFCFPLYELANCFWLRIICFPLLILTCRKQQRNK